MFTGFISWIEFKESIALTKMGVLKLFRVCLLAHCVPLTSCKYNFMYISYCTIPLFYIAYFDWKSTCVYIAMFEDGWILRFVYKEKSRLLSPHSKCVFSTCLIHNSHHPKNIIWNNHIWDIKNKNEIILPNFLM